MPTKVYFGGANTDADTVALLTELQRVSGLAILLTQGSYNPGYGPSGGTHDGGGVVDINTYGWNLATINHCVTVGRSMGGVGWHRTVAQGFTSEHVHLVRADCADLSPSARAQMVQYYAGQNGLAGHGADDGSRDYVGMTWAKYNGTSAYRPPLNIPGPVNPPEDDMTPEQDSRLKNIEKALQFPGGGGDSWSQAIANQMDADRKALLAAVAEVKGIAENVQRQGQTGLGYDWLPALNDKLDGIAKKLS